MTARPKMKMCWNCEGNVQLTEQFCPYCRVMMEDVPETEEEKQPSAAFPPLYNVQSTAVSHEAPFPPPFIKTQAFAQPAAMANDEHADEIVNENLSDTIHIAMTMTLLMAGMILALFGALLFFFSNDGYLVLRWSDSFWFVYFILGAGMLYFGWHLLMQVDES